MEEVENIIKKGVPVKKTREAVREMEVLRSYYISRTGKRIPCGWCNRKSLFRIVSKMVNV